MNLLRANKELVEEWLNDGLTQKRITEIASHQTPLLNVFVFKAENFCNEFHKRKWFCLEEAIRMRN